MSASAFTNADQGSAVSCRSTPSPRVHGCWLAAADAAAGNASVVRTLSPRVDYCVTRGRSVTRHETSRLFRGNSNALTEVDAVNRDEHVPAPSFAESLCVGLAHAAAIQHP